MIALLVADGGHPARLRTLCRKLDTEIPSEACFEILYGRSETAFWLDSSSHTDGQGRYSFMGDASGPLSETISYNVETGLVRTHSVAGTSISRDTIFDFINRRIEAIGFVDQCPAPVPFKGGYVGYLGYELKADCGGRRTHVSSQPDAQFVFADRIVAFDHQTRTAWMICVIEPGTEQVAEAWFSAVESALKNNYLVAKPKFSALNESDPNSPPRWQPRQSEADLVRAVDRVRDTAGREVLREVTLSSSWSATYDGPALGIYQKLRGSQSVPFGAFLRFSDLKVLSFSPERMAIITRDGKVRSEPARGSVPRGASPAHDEDLKSRLQNNQQSRARNLNVAELVASDLRKVCRMGTIRAETLCVVESLSANHHMVSRISGKLRGDETAVTGVRALFPAGSVVGAPKQPALDIIDEIESGPRGILSGSVGYFSLDGAADLNVCGRTIVIDGDQASTASADSIVALSSPAAEIKDLMRKDEGLRTALLSEAPLEFETVNIDAPIQASAE